MSAEDLVFATVALRGVYASFHGEQDGSGLVASAPPDWTLENAQLLVARCHKLIHAGETSISGSRTFRIDIDYISIIAWTVPGGCLVALTRDPPTIDEISSQVEKLVEEYQAAESKTSERPEPTQDPPSRIIAPPKPILPLVKKLPVPGVTMPVNVHATPALRYINEVPIGEGGTAYVYKAFDLRLNREIALKRFKLIDGELQDHRDFEAELQSASRIRHHNVLKTYDTGLDTSGRFMVMELLEGRNLEERVAEKTLRKKFREFALQMLEAVSATHQAGLLHLDLKPSNVMLTEPEHARIHVTLIDFGNARSFSPGDLPKGGGMKGSIYFTSPEYLCADDVDERSDIYSLGCLFYHVLCGEPPFTGETAPIVMAAHLQGLSEDISEKVPDLPHHLGSTIMKMISREPSERPDNILEVMTLFAQRPGGPPKKKASRKAKEAS